jgi:hypothetical protein
MSEAETTVEPKRAELPSRNWSKHTSRSINLRSSLWPHLPWFQRLGPLYQCLNYLHNHWPTGPPVAQACCAVLYNSITTQHTCACLIANRDAIASLSRSSIVIWAHQLCVCFSPLPLQGKNWSWSWVEGWKQATCKQVQLSLSIRMPSPPKDIDLNRNNMWDFNYEIPAYDEKVRTFIKEFRWILM